MVKNMKILNFNEDRFIGNVNCNTDLLWEKYFKSLVKKPYISKTPFKILDAPELNISTESHIFDWSYNNILAILLKDTIYFWEEKTNKITQLDFNVYDKISYIKWNIDNILALLMDDKIVFYNFIDKSTNEIYIPYLFTNNLSWKNERIISISTNKGIILTFDIKNKKINEFIIKNLNNLKIKYSENGSKLACYNNKGITIYNSKNIIFIKNRKINNFEWFPNSDTKFCVNIINYKNSLLEFWDITKDIIKPYKTYKGSKIKDLIFSKTTNDLILIDSNSLSIIDLRSMETKLKIDIESKFIECVLCNNNSGICCLCSDETIKFWKLFPKSNNNIKSLNSEIVIR